MIKKSTIAYFIFSIVLLFIISPWFFEKKLLFNELISIIGLLLFFYHGLKIGKNVISICVALIFFWGIVHLITSLFRLDNFYYYLRNLVIVYSIAAFFIGYHCLKYLGGFIGKIRQLLRVFIGFFLIVKGSGLIFERFGMAMLFPSIFKRARETWVPYLLILINIIYGITYDSSTAMVIAAFYILLFISPGYKFFKQVMIVALLGITFLFIYLIPNLSLISVNYSHYTYTGIRNVMKSNPILMLDANSTWRLVLWKEIIVDNFPANIFGVGYGTPLLKYYPVEDYSKLASLPYILGAHNSFVYLFGRLGIIYVLLIVPVYIKIFKEYFYYKTYYYSNNQILLFWSFFASTMIALFNPALESPIYAAGYWMLLGFVARAIHNRIYLPQNLSPAA